MATPHEARGILSVTNGLGARIAGALRYQAKAVRTSLYPKTETEAQIVEQQLDMLRASLRLLHVMLPLAGAAIVLFAKVGSAAAIWWPILIANCVGDEMLLRRQADWRGHETIARAGARARSMAIMTLVLTLVWTSVIVFTWRSGADHRLNHVFAELILAITLAVVSTMLSLHAGSVLGPILILSGLMIFGPAINNLERNDAMIGLVVVYVVMMLGQAAVIHRRVRYILRLQCERGALIDKLRDAKADSDEAHRRAVEASRAKSAFLANMSHELRTPLNAIIGFSDIIRTNAYGESAEKYGEYGGFIHQSGHRLLDLISDILDLAKIEAGRKLLRPEPVDLVGLARDSAEHARAAANEKNVTVSYVSGHDLPLLNGDMRAVRQIIDNLLSNAVKFTPDGGNIDVSVSLTPAGELMLTVADNGIGIPAEEQRHIFDRFGRTEPQVKAFNHGVGLGLPIVKGLVEMHGGKIALKSELGEGTSVSVVFPASSTVQTTGLKVA